jgi:hypothetical protein
MPPGMRLPKPTGQAWRQLINPAIVREGAIDALNERLVAMAVRGIQDELRLMDEKPASGKIQFAKSNGISEHECRVAMTSKAIHREYVQDKKSACAVKVRRGKAVAADTIPGPRNTQEALERDPEGWCASIHEEIDPLIKMGVLDEGPNSTGYTKAQLLEEGVDINVRKAVFVGLYHTHKFDKSGEVDRLKTRCALKGLKGLPKANREESIQCAFDKNVIIKLPELPAEMVERAKKASASAQPLIAVKHAVDQPESEERGNVSFLLPEVRVEDAPIELGGSVQVLDYKGRKLKADPKTGDLEVWTNCLDPVMQDSVPTESWSMRDHETVRKAQTGKVSQDRTVKNLGNTKSFMFGEKSSQDRTKKSSQADQDLESALRDCYVAIERSSPETNELWDDAEAHAAQGEAHVTGTEDRFIRVCKTAFKLPHHQHTLYRQWLIENVLMPDGRTIQEDDMPITRPYMTGHVLHGSEDRCTLVCDATLKLPHQQHAVRRQWLIETRSRSGTNRHDDLPKSKRLTHGPRACDDPENLGKNGDAMRRQWLIENVYYMYACMTTARFVKKAYAYPAQMGKHGDGCPSQRQPP